MNWPGKYASLTTNAGCWGRDWVLNNCADVKLSSVISPGTQLAISVFTCQLNAPLGTVNRFPIFVFFFFALYVDAVEASTSIPALTQYRLTVPCIVDPGGGGGGWPPPLKPRNIHYYITISVLEVLHIIRYVNLRLTIHYQHSTSDVSFRMECAT